MGDMRSLQTATEINFPIEPHQTTEDGEGNMSKGKYKIEEGTENGKALQAVFSKVN
jgi:hypothetical protein